MDRLAILNHLAQRINAQSYLEIGVCNGYVFNNIKVAHKIGVDPSSVSVANVRMHSDDFFATHDLRFDLIYIDGLHVADQVERDINNSLKILNPGGFIVCHDMLPPDRECQMVPAVKDKWTGDCWKAWVKIRCVNDQLCMAVVDTDYGCGVISRGRQSLLTIDCDLTYDAFESHKMRWMNIISVGQFLNLPSRLS